MSRPGFGWEVRRGVLDGLADGLSLAATARLCGVSKSYVHSVYQSVGGVCRPPGMEYSDRFLDREERYEIARLLEEHHSAREIARVLGRAPSTITREIARNRDPRSGSYQPERAHQLAWRRQRRPKPSKLALDPRLREEVQKRLDLRWSPEQIAGRLPVDFPDDERMRISHETIYLGLYVYPRGELTRELRARLRQGRAGAVRGRRETRGKIPDAVSIHDRPEEVAERLVPGHHEGDLIKGSLASNSAVGTIVERHSGFLTLLHLPNGYGAAQVADAVTKAMTPLPDWFAKTLTWDRGTEMVQHATITHRTGIKVYFADPYSPQQRPSNENTNGLLREYMPKGTDLSLHTATDLQHIADQLNDRPRKRLGYRTPREILAILTEQQRVATTP